MSDPKGILLGLSASLFGALLVVTSGSLLLSVSATLAAAVMFGVGVIQFVYILPAFLAARKQNRHGMKTGLLIGAAIVFFLNCVAGLLILAARHDFARP